MKKEKGKRVGASLSLSLSMSRSDLFAAPLKEGWLNKVQGLSKKKYHFRMEGGQLTFYKDEARDAVPAGFLEMSTCTGVAAEKKGVFTLSMADGKGVKLQALGDDRDEWVEFLEDWCLSNA